MKFTIEQIKSISVVEDNKIVIQPGWALIDSDKHTIIQVYGKKKLNLLIKYFSNVQINI